MNNRNTAATIHVASATIMAAILLLFCVSGQAQTVAPFQGVGNAQFYDNNGNVLTSGVLYSYAAGTTTQQATYTDSTGLTLNPDPIPFTSGARANIWLTVGAFYKFVLCLQNDGAFCAPADVLFSVDNVPVAATAASGSPFIGIFISATAGTATSGVLRLASGDTVCWRNTGGTTNLCLGKTSLDLLSWPGSVTIGGQINSTVVTGTPPFVVASTTQVANLNASQLVGCTWAAPCPIGSTTPNTGAFTTLTAPTITVTSSFVLNAPTTGSGVQGTGTKVETAGTNSGTSGSILCNDINGAATTSGCGLTKIQAVKKAGGCSTGGGSNSACQDTLTWPATFGDTTYIPVCQGLTPNQFIGQSTSNQAANLVIDSYTATTITVTTTSNRSLAAQFSEIDCIGVHP